jgi:TatD DNase family protein
MKKGGSWAAVAGGGASSTRAPAPAAAAPAVAQSNAPPAVAKARPQVERKTADSEAVAVRCPKPLVDIGLNLKHKSFAKDLQDVLLRAAQANVTGFICTGTNESNSQKTVQLIAQLRDVRRIAESGVFLYSTAGVHPHDAKTCNSTTIGNLRKLIEKNRDIIVSVGECGLDFNRNFSTPEQQVRAFEDQVRLACQLQLPLFTHERDSHQQFIEVLDKVSGSGGDSKEEDKLTLPKICVHCFTGSEEELEEYVRRGYYIGITGYVCKRKRGAGLLSYVSKIPKEKLMIETDAPFMAPEDDRLDRRYRERNEPSTLPIILERLAEAMGATVEELAEIVTKNTWEFFNLANVPKLDG